MSHKYSLDTLIDIENRKIFFDANVLIYIFWSSGSQKWEAQYSSIFRNLLLNDYEMCVDFMVISEIINKMHRIDYRNYIKNNNLDVEDFNYKTYRTSQPGIASLLDIYLVVKDEILEKFTVIGKNYSKEDILSLFATDCLDFNDRAILMECKENDCVLLTNDRDFKNCDIDILTTNPRLLN